MRQLTYNAVYSDVKFGREGTEVIRARLILASVVGLTTFSGSAFGNDACQNLFRENPIPTLEQMRAVAAKLPEDARLFRQAAYLIWKRVTDASPPLSRIFPESAVLPLILREDTQYFAVAIHDVFTRIEAAGRNSAEVSLRNDVFNGFLSGKVPASQIPGRMDSYLKAEAKTADSLAAALGQMSVEQVQHWVHSGNPLNPAPDSLLGKYIAETGAATVVRSFSTVPGNAGPQGPPRLVVAVSAESFPAYLELFAKPNFLVHIHTPGQGTLLVGHNGRLGTYSRLQTAMSFPGIGTVMPHVLLSSTEGQRANEFFALGTANRHDAMYPWNLQGPEGAYSATSGYRCCTFWIGNIPLGDRRVQEYTFAGNQEGQQPGPGPQTAQLRPHTSDNLLLRQVYQVPGHEQLSHVLGQADANSRGEFANPGWVLITLTGPTTVDRVPVVFTAVEDHRLPINPEFPRGDAAH